MLLILWFAAAVLATTQAYTYKQANAYIDFVLREPFAKEQQYSRLDPYKLPNIHVNLLSWSKYENKANLTKGHLMNLSQVRRSGDCSVPQWHSANISFTCNLQFNDLRINYTANVTHDNMQLVFDTDTSVKGTEITIQITTTKEENIPNLRLFYITEIGLMTVTNRIFTMKDVSRVVGPPVRDAIVSNSTTNLHKALNGRFKDALAFSIYKTPVPF